MFGKIVLEEHFALEETVGESLAFMSESVWPELRHRLLDIHDTRLRQMDEHGIELMLLSLNAPAVQAVPDPAQAEGLSQRANDFLAEQVAKRPDRFQALAALPMQSPELATRELERCVRKLGFKGVLINGFSEVAGVEGPVYYDLPQYRPFWAAVEAFDVPFYLHPRNPLPADTRIYQGHPWLLGPTWAFAQETAVHALRLMASGLFDVHPGLSIVLGHLAEGLPYSMWRIDNRNAWMDVKPAYPAKKRFTEYFQSNFYFSTSGNFRTQTLIDAILEVGADRIMFSVDWPFENIDHATKWFDAATISEADRLKIGRLNAQKLFKLG